MLFSLWVPVVRLAQGQLVEDFSLLEPGDVVLARSRRTNRKTGDEFWWNRFEVVTHVYNENTVKAIPLRLDTTMANEHFLARNGHKNMAADHLTFIHPDHYPEGVSAMYMKFVMKGIIKPSGG